MIDLRLKRAVSHIWSSLNKSDSRPTSFFAFFIVHFKTWLQVLSKWFVHVSNFSLSYFGILIASGLTSTRTILSSFRVPGKSWLLRTLYPLWLRCNVIFSMSIIYSYVPLQYFYLSSALQIDLFSFKPKRTIFIQGPMLLVSSYYIFKVPFYYKYLR